MFCFGNLKHNYHQSITPSVSVCQNNLPFLHKLYFAQQLIPKVFRRAATEHVVSRLEWVRLVCFCRWRPPFVFLNFDNAAALPPSATSPCATHSCGKVAHLLRRKSRNHVCFHGLHVLTIRKTLTTNGLKQNSSKLRLFL